MYTSDETALGTWIYCIALSIFSMVGGILCVYYGVDVLLYNSEVTNLCGIISTGSGGVICTAVLCWTYVAVLFKRQNKIFRKISMEEFNSNGGQNYERSPMKVIHLDFTKKKARKLKRIKEVILRSRVIFVVLLLMAILSEVTLTGILWYTSTLMNRTYTIQNNCFCRLSGPYMFNKYQAIKDCPEFDEDHKLIHCLSLYEQETLVNKNYTSFTIPCQELSGEGDMDESCVEWRRFWLWFKILRLLLPFLAFIQSPIIFVNCISYSEYLSSKKKEETQVEKDTSWINLKDLPVEEKIDPLLFYGNICSPVQVNPPLEERLGPYGQEQSKTETSTILRASALMSRKRLSCGPVIVKCPIAPNVSPSALDGTPNTIVGDTDADLDIQFCAQGSESGNRIWIQNQKYLRGSESPPNSGINAFSTPVLSKREETDSPNFDVSHVMRITPARPQPPNITIIDGDLSRSRLSSFGPGKQDNTLSIALQTHHIPPTDLEMLHADFPPPPPLTEEENFIDGNQHCLQGDWNVNEQISDISNIGVVTPECRRSRSMSVSTLHAENEEEQENAA